MKAQCCICSDLFDQDGDANISAVACGHTFHEVCLMKWLDTSSTCPHCRKRVNQKHIVKKLYFDKAEDYDETTDNPEKLINEVDQLRLELRKKQKHAEEVEENKERLNQRIEDILSAKKAVEKQYKKEQTSNNCLRKQLAFYESQQRALESEREEYKSVKNKLLDMKSVQNLLEGCDSDAQELLSQYGEGEGSVRQLATYCAVLKREYDKSKTEKKLLKDELEKRRKDLLAKERALSDKVKQVSTLEDQLRYSENDLKFAEKERELLKQKIRRLKQDLQSPCSTASASFVKAYTEENIMPSTPVSLQKPPNGSKIIDLADDFDMDVCTDAALTPDIIPPSPHSSLKRQCEENDLQYVKISSASDKQQTKRVKSEMSDISNLAAMNIFKNKARPDYSSTVRRGCNGLGGYTTYVQPTGFGKFLSKKPSSKPRANIKPLASRASKKTPLPDYPKLDLFLGKD